MIGLLWLMVCIASSLWLWYTYSRFQFYLGIGLGDVTDWKSNMILGMIILAFIVGLSLYGSLSYFHSIAYSLPALPGPMKGG